jgi:hypothetical protein
MGKANAHLLPSVTYLSLFTVILMFALAFFFQDPNNKFLRVGPQTDLIVVSVRIDTAASYTVLILLLTFVTAVRAYVSEVGNAILRYYIYDMNTQHIEDINMLNLVVHSNATYFLSMVRDMLLTIVGIAQIDLAMWTIIVYTLVEIGAITWHLWDKRFDIPSPSWTSCCTVICLCFCTPGTLINTQAYKVTEQEEKT